MPKQKKDARTPTNTGRKRPQNRNEKVRLSKEDFEKILLGSLLTLVVIIVCVKFLTTGSSDANMIYLAGILAGSFVARKAFKYAFGRRSGYEYGYGYDNEYDDSVIPPELENKVNQNITGD